MRPLARLFPLALAPLLALACGTSDGSGSNVTVVNEASGGESASGGQASGASGATGTSAGGKSQGSTGGTTGASGQTSANGGSMSSAGGMTATGGSSQATGGAAQGGAPSAGAAGMPAQAGASQAGAPQGGSSQAGASQGGSAGGPSSCGDGDCDPGETCTLCPQDCGACPATCPDGTCAADESCSTCPQDCGACQIACGDGTCASPAESCSSCPDDCGACAETCPVLAFPSGIHLKTVEDPAMTALYEGKADDSCFPLPKCFIDLNDLEDPVAGTTYTLDVKLAPHFALNELVGTELSYTTKALLSPALIEQLEVYREKAGNKPVNITSGYRSPQHQKAVCNQVCPNGEDCCPNDPSNPCACRSRHEWGDAADIASSDPSSLYPYASQCSFGFCLSETGHLHVDMSPCGAGCPP